ncbi:unnamed protein product [Cyprideis torosa]|uniref:Succinate-semialdehyde dehydrogenase, mitochondrial n=1 Tax=Cyprideis torosa TaxID=163714 RepID=A0A7R8ZH57_9CRUS|nr:unnamed protein product [Cyprideis torosa]CAG0882898.1 unnamed protein product [Cyprideis torosa]
MSRTGAWRTLLHMCNCCSGGTVVRSPRPLSRILAPCSARAYHSLIRDQSFVNGQWVPGSTAATFPVLNPANLSEVGSVADLAGEDVEQAIHAAREAFHPWADLTAKERGKYLRRWYELMEERKNELSQIMTLENGKPILEAEAEISYASSFLEWFAEEGKRIYGKISSSGTTQSLPCSFPSVPQWNFPAAMITRKVGAALASGCPVVVKPAEDTPLTALALAALAEEAGFPPGVVNVVTCGRENSIAAGKLFCSSPSIAGISFTGSTDVGKQLYAQCAPHVKRLSLELGGDAPFVVFESADVPAAVDGAMISKFRNAGQTCVCANRFFVHSAVYDEFVTGLRDRMKSLKVGNGLSPGVTIGPIINEAQIKRLEGLLADACSRGAELTVGGHRMPEVGPLFFAPTMIEHMSNEFACMTEEQFGPVVAVSRFETEEEVFHLANSSDRGLAGYAFTRDVGQALRIARYLEVVQSLSLPAISLTPTVGILGINEGMISACEMPFGGVKESGLGREGSKYGVEEFTYIKYVKLGGMGNSVVCVHFMSEDSYMLVSRICKQFLAGRSLGAVHYPSGPSSLVLAAQCCCTYRRRPRMSSSRAPHSPPPLPPPQATFPPRQPPSSAYPP